MTTLNIRNVDERVARSIRADAARHGLTLNEWLSAAEGVLTALRAHNGSIITDPKALQRAAKQGGALSGADYTEVAALLTMHGLGDD